MMRIKPVLLAIISFSLIQSCSKEESIERPFNQGSGDTTIAANCTIQQIITVDTATGRGRSSLATVFGADDKPARIVYFDSTSNTEEMAADLRYHGDTVVLGSGQYAVTDANGRVKSLQSISLYDSSSITFNYSYDAKGFLSQKVSPDYVSGLGDLVFDYQWEDSNLVKVTGKLKTPFGELALYESRLEYTTLSAPEFIYVFPEAYESIYYILALDLGRKSKNLIKKVTLTVSDLQGDSETYITEFSDYQFDQRGLVTEFNVKNNSQDALFLLEGKTRLAYRCK